MKKSKKKTNKTKMIKEKNYFGEKYYMIFSLSIPL